MIYTMKNVLVQKAAEKIFNQEMAAGADPFEAKMKLEWMKRWGTGRRYGMKIQEQYDTVYYKVYREEIEAGRTQDEAKHAADEAWNMFIEDFKRNKPSLLQTAAGFFAPVLAVVGGPAGAVVAGALTGAAVSDYQKQVEREEKLVADARSLAPYMREIMDKAVSTNDLFSRLNARLPGAATYWKQVPGFVDLVDNAFAVKRAARTRGLQPRQGMIA